MMALESQHGSSLERSGEGDPGELHCLVCVAEWHFMYIAEPLVMQLVQLTWTTDFSLPIWDKASRSGIKVSVNTVAESEKR